MKAQSLEFLLHAFNVFKCTARSVDCHFKITAPRFFTDANHDAVKRDFRLDIYFDDRGLTGNLASKRGIKG